MKYLRLMLEAPDFFTGKTIEHNGFSIEFNKDYKGDMPEAMAIAIKEIVFASQKTNVSTRLFDYMIVEDNIDLDNLPSKLTDETSILWYNLIKLGFKVEYRLGSSGDWIEGQTRIQGWNYRISPNNTQTLENIRNS